MVEKTKAVAVKEIAIKDNSPVGIISKIVSGNMQFTPEQLDKFLTLQERFDGNEARKAYHIAMSEFKSNSPKVTKDKINKQYNSRYTSLNNLVNIVNPELSKHGLSASWDIEQNGIIKVTCKITHIKGHSETASMSAPKDESGAKNIIQQIKSTITYLKAVTFESICGLASSDANLDDDGNIASIELVSEKEVNQMTDYIDLLKIDMTKFLAYMKIDKIQDMPKKDYIKAMAAIQQKKKVDGGK